MQTHDGNGSLDHSAAHAETAETEADEGNSHRKDVVATVATVAVVGIGAAAFEAALLPGLVLGVAAMWLPQYFPKMGEALNPLFRSTVRGVYKIGQKSREMVAEAQEQVHDIVAEVHAESDAEPPASKAAAAGRETIQAVVPTGYIDRSDASTDRTQGGRRTTFRRHPDMTETRGPEGTSAASPTGLSSLPKVE